MDFDFFTSMPIETMEIYQGHNKSIDIYIEALPTSQILEIGQILRL